MVERRTENGSNGRKSLPRQTAFGKAEPERFCREWLASLTIEARGKQTESMKELLSRVFQMDFLKGMGVTFRTQFPSNIYTEQYPLERPRVAERYRGAPRLNKNPETGETLCIGCNLCALACPEN